jgi:hypothetical protein
MPVTSIGNDAFYNQKNLRAVYIPEGVKQIGLNAFSLCTALEEVRMPESLEKIGKGAFYGCESLASLHIPAGVKYINPGAFMSQSAGFRLDVDENNTEYHWAGNCLISTWKKTLVYGNETSVIPDDGSVETIGMYAFMYSKHLTEIDIPASVTKIEDEAFSTCTSLETVTVRGAKIIKRCAFQGCTGLKKVSLPDTLTTLGGNAFENCRALKQVSIPAGVRQVESCAFQGCTALWQVKLAEGLRSIEERAFRGCIALAEIEIPDTVTVLGAGAFSGCSSLENVILSAKLTRVEESTF